MSEQADCEAKLQELREKLRKTRQGVGVRMAETASVFADRAASQSLKKKRKTIRADPPVFLSVLVRMMTSWDFVARPPLG